MSSPTAADALPTQSPIDIVDNGDQLKVEVLDATQVKLKLGTAEAELAHHGANFQVNWANREQNVLVLDGKTYYTVQFHFHAPSAFRIAWYWWCWTLCLFLTVDCLAGEHTLNGDARDMELHVVHQSEDGELAVVGLFFTEGAENAFLAQFWHELPKLKGVTHAHVKLGSISADALHPLAGKFYRYTGSLTTPPYSEGVKWIVAQDAVEASAEQLEVYRSFIPAPNARACQALNGRSVSLHECAVTAP